VKNFSERSRLRSRRVDALEDRYQEPIEDLLRHLYYDQHLTLAEIAERLEVPAGTVGNWMVRLGINQRAMAEQAAKELAS
jgi:DNA-directed RNA polymerase specialized sigma24 family protein